MSNGTQPIPGLSQSRAMCLPTHHHVYELSSTAGEARSLIDEVIWLNEQRAPTSPA